MSISVPPYDQGRNVRGRPETLLSINLSQSSEDVTLGTDADSWLITFIFGTLNCDAGPAFWGFDVNDNPIWRQVAQTSATFDSFAIELYTFIPLNPVWKTRFWVGAAPVGGSFCNLNLIVAGYHSGLYL